MIGEQMRQGLSDREAEKKFQDYLQSDARDETARSMKRDMERMSKANPKERMRYQIEALQKRLEMLDHEKEKLGHEIERLQREKEKVDAAEKDAAK
jgi:hypothetical protein